MTAPDTLPPELEELGALLREDPPAPGPDVGPASSTPARRPASPGRRAGGRAARLKPRREWFLPAAGLTAAAAVAVIVVIGVVLARQHGRRRLGRLRRRRLRRARAPPRRRAPAATACAQLGRRREQRGQRRLDQRSPRRSVPPSSGGGSPRLRLAHRRASSRAQRLDDARRPAARDRGRRRRHRARHRRGGRLRRPPRRCPAARAATFDLRIPTSRLQKTLAALSALAHVRERTQSTPRHHRRVGRRPATACARPAPSARACSSALADAHTLNETESLKARLRYVNARDRLGPARRCAASTTARATPTSP